MRRNLPQIREQSEQAAQERAALSVDANKLQDKIDSLNQKRGVNKLQDKTKAIADQIQGLFDQSNGSDNPVELDKISAQVKKLSDERNQIVESIQRIKDSTKDRFRKELDDLDILDEELYSKERKLGRYRNAVGNVGLVASPKDLDLKNPFAQKAVESNIANRIPISVKLSFL